MSNSRSTPTPSPVSACDILKAMFKNPVKNQPGFLNELVRANSACDLGLVVSPMSQPDDRLYTFPSSFQAEREMVEQTAERSKNGIRRK